MREVPRHDIPSVDEGALSLLAQKGDNAAKTELVSRYTKTARARASYYAGSVHEVDDLAQEGLIGLNSAIMSYNPDCGAAFSTFAYLCINRSIITAIKTHNSKKNIPHANLLSIDDEAAAIIDALPSAELSPEEVVISREDAASLIKKISEILSPFEFKVLNAHLSGDTYEVIARKLGVSVKVVDNALQRARGKLR